MQAFWHENIGAKRKVFMQSQVFLKSATGGQSRNCMHMGKIYNLEPSFL